MLKSHLQEVQKLRCISGFNIAHENDKMNIMSRNYLMEPAVTKLENVLEATLLHLIMSPVERKEHYVFGKNLSKNFI